jgi:hypothetical protein
MFMGEESRPMTMLNEPRVCPNCRGEGTVTITEEKMRAYLESCWQWEALRRKSNAELAGIVCKIENYLRHRDLSPLAFTFL